MSPSPSPQQLTPRGVAIVTGGRRGIGAAAATALAGEGFSVAIVDIERDALADATLAAVRGKGARGMFIRADIGELEAHDDLVSQVTHELGTVTCLVNNAGVQVPVRADLLETSPEVFDRLIGINLRGTFFLTQAVAKAMAREPAEGLYRSIVIVSSANATMASVEKGAYCVSKSALSMVTQLFATRMAEHDVDVFEIQPGLIRTDMTAAVRDSYGQAIAAGLSPNRRWGEADDIGRVISTLVTGKLPFSTGTMIPAGGGLNIHRL
jgi:NAD(P)-dependent dehydrogenase (short-subunit alcohol dehydrogenase family)